MTDKIIFITPEIRIDDKVIRFMGTHPEIAVSKSSSEAVTYVVRAEWQTTKWKGLSKDEAKK